MLQPSVNRARPVSVLLVDDHAVVREGYKRLLERRGDIAVIGEAANAAGCVRAVLQACAAGRGHGHRATRREWHRRHGAHPRAGTRDPRADVQHVRRGDLREPSPARRCVRLRHEGERAEVLVEAVHAITQGRRYISADIAQKLALRNVVADTDANGGLSAREFEVLRLLVQGLSVRDIAQSMGSTQASRAPSSAKLRRDAAVQLVRRRSPGFGRVVHQVSRAMTSYTVEQAGASRSICRHLELFAATNSDVGWAVAKQALIVAHCPILLGAGYRRFLLDPWLLGAPAA